MIPPPHPKIKTESRAPAARPVRLRHFKSVPHIFEDGITRRFQKVECCGIFAIRISGSPNSTGARLRRARTLFGVRRKRLAAQAAEPCAAFFMEEIGYSFAPHEFVIILRPTAERTRHARPFCCGGELSPLYLIRLKSTFFIVYFINASADSIIIFSSKR